MTTCHEAPTLIAMTHKELIETVLIEGNLTRFFKLCSTEGHDPLEVRHNGLNIVTALLLAEISPEQKVRDFDALLSGFHNLGRATLARMVEEELQPPVNPREPALAMTKALPLLAGKVVFSDFELLFALLRSKGYTPNEAALGEIEAALSLRHPDSKRLISKLLSL